MSLMNELKQLEPAQTREALGVTVERMGINAVNEEEDALADANADAARDLLIRDYPALAQLIISAGEKVLEMGGTEDEASVGRVGAMMVVMTLKDCAENQSLPPMGSP